MNVAKVSETLYALRRRVFHAISLSIPVLFIILPGCGLQLAGEPDDARDPASE